MITIDGYTWPVPCDITRMAEMKPSEISGFMLDRSYFNDVLGTYMRYDVSLAVPPSMEDDYSTLYQTLTEPVDGHQFVMPHNSTTLQVTGRVESVKDTLIYTVSHKQYWKGISFTIIANHPSRYESLGAVIERGRTPFPEIVNVPIGTLYEMTEDGWEQADYEDADSRYY